MKRLVCLLSTCSLLACGPAPTAGFPTPTIALDAGNSTLGVTVDRVKVGKGTVYCALFNAADGFPGASLIIGGSSHAEATAAQVACSFSSLPAGAYGVSVFQDENSNGALDSNSFGVPTEGYGVSNNVIPPAAPPRWSDSQITVDGTSPLDITINLKN